MKRFKEPYDLIPRKKVWSFLRLTGYYRDFNPNYAEITHDLTEARKKRAANTVVWEAMHKKAFDVIKIRLSRIHILRTPDLSKDFILRTDAPSKCVGAVFMQGNNQKLHPVSYVSHKLLLVPSFGLGNNKISCVPA